MHPEFPPASWPTSLKLVSLFGTMALLFAMVAAHAAIPESDGFTRQFGLGIAVVPIVVLVGAALTVVNGYSIDGTDLSIRRLLTSTRVPLSGLTRIRNEPQVCKRSIRIFGNGGLYSFTGWFYNKQLGRYRAYATDFSHAVVLDLGDRTVVVTPADPDAFIEHLSQRFPMLRTQA